MMGIWSSYLHIYLYVIAVVMFLGFGLPLLFVPMQWARLFRWEIPEQKQLAVFMGRSVGVLISVLSIFAYKAANNPPVQPFFMEMVLWITVGSFLIHVYGALKKAQPITETMEILVWVLLFFATLAFYPV